MSGEHNSNNKTINSHGLAENDRNQVLGLDPRSFDTTTNDRGTSGVDAQSGTNHGQGDCEAHAQGCPHVGRGLSEEPSNAQSFTTTGQHIVQDCQMKKEKFDISVQKGFKDLTANLLMTIAMK